MFRAARAAVLCSALTLFTPAVRTHAQPGASTQFHGIDLPSATESDRQRVSAAAREAMERLTEWFGPAPATPSRIVARPWKGASPVDSTSLVLDVSWRSAPETMDLESQTAFGIARLWWPGLRKHADNAPIADGLAWYLQSRIVDRLFDFSFLVPGHSAMGDRYFGGAWPWAFRILPLGRWSGGLGREEYLRSRSSRSFSHAPARRLPPELTPSGLRGAHAFATLEQLVGWPTLQGALRVTAGAANGEMTRQEFQQRIASATGRELAWFFRAAFDDSVGFDYAVQELTTGESAPCGAGPCFRTRVAVARLGSGQFTGRSEPSSGSFESGDGMELRVSFADGQQATARWDGRAAARTFEFDSASAAVAAAVDPERILLLDENVLNNTIRTDVRPNVAIAKWVAYWLVWLEGAALGYSGLF